MSERLLVIGNGMARAGTAQEILDRNPERFATTIFGE
jgi:NAD(P)H-nitrite reductase large subunit